MPQSLSNVLLHIVFSTKNRQKSIDFKIEPELHRYVGGILRGLESPSLAIGGLEDHLHVLCILSRTIAIADLVRTIKRESSKWMKNRHYSKFYWQSGYGAFSIGHSGKSQAIGYIANQRKHHARRTFQDEFRALLRKYEIPFDERYVWD